jgi:hypothetical protein
MLYSSLIPHPRWSSVKFQKISASVDAEDELRLQRRKSTTEIAALRTRFATTVLLTYTEISNSILWPHTSISVGFIFYSLLLIRYFLCFTENWNQVERIKFKTPDCELFSVPREFVKLLYNTLYSNAATILALGKHSAATLWWRLDL